MVKLRNENKYMFKKAILVTFLLLISVTIYLIVKPPKNKVKKNNYYKCKIEARKYFRNGEKYKAIGKGYECIKENPDNVNGYFFVVKTLIDLADYDEASKYLNMAKNKCVSERDNETYNILAETLEYDKKEVQKHKDLSSKKSFLEELYKNGAKIKKCKIGYTKEGIRGILATENINKGEILVEIPKNLLITDEQAQEYLTDKYSKETKMTKEEIKDIFKKCYATSKFEIILYILENEKQISPSYINILKSAPVETFPNIIDEKYIKLLENTEAIDSINSKKEVLKHDIGLLYKIEPIRKYKFELLARYYFIVQSRLFNININGKDLSALVPYIDMYNHNNNTDNYTTWNYNKDKECFCIEAYNYIDKGEEVFTSYGTKSNTDLYILYGFTQKDNERKSVTLEFNNKKYKCIEIYRHEKNELQNLLHNIKEYVTNTNKKKRKPEQLKIAKFSKFIEICNDKLNKYQTKLESDLKDIETDNISIHKYNILNILISEKQLLKKYISSANKCIKTIKRYGLNKIDNAIREDKTLDYLSKEFLKD